MLQSASDPRTVLRRAFGYEGFRPGQEELVRAVLGGRDALGVLPTGGGKSVCYQVPAFLVDDLTLVVTPLVSLMEDQVQRAREIGLRADCLTGTQSTATKREVVARVRAGTTRLLLVSPERLELEPFRGLLCDVRVGLVAVDEAHCISEWGHDFRPSYRRIAAVSRRLGCPTLALTASATPEVRADILDNLRLRDPLVVVRSFDRPNLRWAVVRSGGRRARKRAIYQTLRRLRGVAIVYAPTRRSVELVRDHLAGCGLPVDGYHAGLPGEERSRVQERFMSGDCRVVVATNAFGMGIDKADVRSVLHVQLPTTLEAYYQEAGRAGRDGEPSVCLAFHARGDGALGTRFLDSTHPPLRRLRRIHRVLRRTAEGGGTVSPEDPALVRLLGAPPREWMDGDPVGPLGALERYGAIRRVGGMGGGSSASDRASDSYDGAAPLVGPGVRILVHRSPDLDAARALRRRARDKLRAVRRYARTSRCRRNEILRYFGERRGDRCGQCDRCGWRVEEGV